MKKIILLMLVFLPAQSLAFESFNRVTEYDGMFKKYSKRYFGPAFNWRYFKAQGIAESGLKPKAKSPVGAVGLMQIMPRTYREIKGQNKAIKGFSSNPKWNIAAGIYYDREMWKIWKAKRPLWDRIAFMFGSYNAGKGSILKAQKIADSKGINPNHWKSISKTLPSVTGKRSKETIHYVKKIKKIKEVLR